MTIRRGAIGAILCVVCLTGHAEAQFSGQLQGTVQDQTGARHARR